MRSVRATPRTATRMSAQIMCTRVSAQYARDTLKRRSHHTVHAACIRIAYAIPNHDLPERRVMWCLLSGGDAPRFSVPMMRLHPETTRNTRSPVYVGTVKMDRLVWCSSNHLLWLVATWQRTPLCSCTRTIRSRQCATTTTYSQAIKHCCVPCSCSVAQHKAIACPLLRDRESQPASQPPTDRAQIIHILSIWCSYIKHNIYCISYIYASAAASV